MKKLMIRIIAVVSAMLLALPTVLSISGGTEVYDINNDGSIDTKDIVRLMKDMAKDTACFDINGDGSYDTRDLVALMKAIAADIDMSDVTLKSELAYIPTNNLFAVGDNDEYAFVMLEGFDGIVNSRYADGELMADIEMLSRILGLDCSRSGGYTTLSFGNASVRINETSGTVLSSGRAVARLATLTDGDRLLVSADKLASELGYKKQYDGTNGISYYYSTARVMTDANKETIKERFQLYREVVCNTSDVEADQRGVGIYKKTPEDERVVGIAYSTWHSSMSVWGSQTWSMPLYGPYYSDDEWIIRLHGEQLAAAGVDFVFIDWSNNTLYNADVSYDKGMSMIEDATTKVFDIWKTIPNAPKICIFVGPGHSGRASITSGDHQRKVDQVYSTYVNNPKYRDQYYYYNGKPLLICYGATPNQYTSTPSNLWNDSRFEIRWMSGYVSQQRSLMKDMTNLVSGGFWSWEERGAQSFTVDNNGYVECINIVASSRESGSGNNITTPAYGRENGATFKRAFQRANDLGARIALIVSWNEWMSGEQPSAEISKDIEPSAVDGTLYLDLMTQQIKKFKGLS